MKNINWREVGFWIAVPTILATEDNPKKWARVVGFLLAFLLFPPPFVGLLFLTIAVVIDIIKGI